MPSLDINKPCDFTIFGVLGDLSRRKLIPSLYQLDIAGLLHEDTRIIGVARHELSQEDFVARMRDSLETFVKDSLEPDVVERLLNRLHYVLINLDVPEEYSRLQEVIDQEQRVLVNYFSVAPSLFDDICKGLDHAAIVTSETRVVLEKPIGRDLETSQEINDTVARVFTEDQPDNPGGCTCWSSFILSVCLGRCCRRFKDRLMFHRRFFEGNRWLDNALFFMG